MSNKRDTSREEFSFVDLFAGAGGFTEGFLLAGNNSKSFHLVAASDMHHNAYLTYSNRFQRQLGLEYTFIKEDIRSPAFLRQLRAAVKKYKSGSLDVVCGGPPCQGFSVFGKRQEKDPRNDLFLSYLGAIQALAPKYFVMENVPGIVSMYNGKTVERIYSEVAALGPIKYHLVGPIKVNATHFGVPQCRERVLFIGHREDVKPVEKIMPTHAGTSVTVRDAIGDLAFLRAWESNGHYHPGYPPLTRYQQESRRGRLFKKIGKARKDLELKNHDAPRHTPDVIARFAMIEVGHGLETIPREAWEMHLKTSKKWCVKLAPDHPSYTMVTLPDDFVHYERPRALTVREMARLQSFDDTFEFLGPRSSGGGGKGNKKRNVELPQYSQVGNAVPPLMAKGIAQALLTALGGKKFKEGTNEAPHELHHGLRFQDSA